MNGMFRRLEAVLLKTRSQEKFWGFFFLVFKVGRLTCSTLCFKIMNMVVVWWQRRLINWRTVPVDQEKRNECLNLALVLRRRKKGLKGDLEIKSEDLPFSRMGEQDSSTLRISKRVSILIQPNSRLPSHQVYSKKGAWQDTGDELGLPNLGPLLALISLMRKSTSNRAQLFIKQFRKGEDGKSQHQPDLKDGLISRPYQE